MAHEFFMKLFDIHMVSIEFNKASAIILWCATCYVESGHD